MTYIAIIFVLALLLMFLQYANKIEISLFANVKVYFVYGLIALALIIIARI